MLSSCSGGVFITSSPSKKECQSPAFEAIILEVGDKGVEFSVKLEGLGIGAWVYKPENRVGLPNWEAEAMRRGERRGGNRRSRSRNTIAHQEKYHTQRDRPATLPQPHAYAQHCSCHEPNASVIKK